MKCSAYGWTTAVLLLASATGSLLAQAFPAGVQGTWKIVRKMQTDAGAGACAGAAPNIPKGAKVSIGEHALLLEGQGMNDARPSVQTITPSQFTQQYLGGSEKDFKKLGLGNGNLEVITPASETAGSEFTVFDRVIVRDPSSLLLLRCGTFFEAVHAGGFQAPRLPGRS